MEILIYAVMTLSLATLPTALAGPTPLQLVNSARSALRPTFDAVDESTHFHLKRVLDAFRKHNVGAHHFAGVDGYGHGDLGREALDAVYADLLGAEAALVRELESEIAALNAVHASLSPVLVLQSAARAKLARADAADRRAAAPAEKPAAPPAPTARPARGGASRR